MNYEKKIQGLSLKVGPLGESDRLLTVLSDQEGISRLAVPGGRKPGSKLAAATPLTFLDLEIGGRSELKRVRQLNVLRTFSKVGAQLETLSAAQSIAELSLLLVAGNDPIPNMLKTVLIHLDRLDSLSKDSSLNQLKILATTIQSFVHLLALGGYGLPVQNCCHTGQLLNPPLGDWHWRCSFLKDSGFAIGSFPASDMQLNPSELALLQRLFRPELPRTSQGELMGPFKVWMKLLFIIESWTYYNLSNKVNSLQLLRETLVLENNLEKKH